MKKIILVALSVSFSLLIQAQTKREQIDKLSFSADSLQRVIDSLVVDAEKQKASRNAEVAMLNAQIADCERQKNENQKEINALENANSKLRSENTKLNFDLIALRDSLSISKQMLGNAIQERSCLVNAAYQMVIDRWGYFLGDFGDLVSLNNLKKNDLTTFSNEDRIVNFILTDSHLMASYRINGVSESESIIIRISDGKNAVNEGEKNLFIESFNLDLGKVKMEMEGQDANGHYWRSGTFDMKSDVLQLEAKHY
jgi:hypothetical protein